MLKINLLPMDMRDEAFPTYFGNRVQYNGYSAEIFNDQTGSSYRLIPHHFGRYLLTVEEVKNESKA
jgi:hypothetical protein